MRELDRIPTLPLTAGATATGALSSCAIIGAGRLGTALSTALRATGLTIEGPLGRGADPGGVDAVLLCVPDDQIAAAAAAVSAGLPVGHCSGATPLGALAGREAFAMHPLMTVPGAGEAGRQRGAKAAMKRDGATSVFAGAAAAVAGSTPRALSIAQELAGRLGMRTVTIADEDRAAYHAAASIASNFLTTLEGAAERLAATAGVDRELLAPLVRASVEAWVRLGAGAALTGPIARGDEATVARQRAAVQERTPDLLPLYDALADATRTLARTAR